MEEPVDSPPIGVSNGPQEGRRALLRRVETHVMGRMGSGTLLLIPLLVTLAVVEFFILSFGRLFGPIVDLVNASPYVQNLPNWSVWLIFVAIICGILYTLGSLFASETARQRVMRWQTVVLSRVPVVKTVYNIAHQATEALSASANREFSRVVFVEWPRPGMRALGFVTGKSALRKSEGRSVVVYIPTVPNPTSGNLAFVSEDQVIETDYTIEDAMKVVFSGGIVLPQTQRQESLEPEREQPDAPLKANPDP